MMNRVMRGEVQADVIISGSSRAMYHYDPRIIEAATHMKVYNIGRNGTKLHEQLDFLRLYLRRNTRPTMLIQNLDLASLQENDDVTDPKQYVAWLGDEEVYLPLVRRKRYYFFYRWCPLLALAATGGARQAVEGLLGLDGAAATELKGYEPQSLVWTRDFEAFRARYPSGLDWKIDPAKERSLMELVEFCESNNVRPILVYSPDYRVTQAFFHARERTVRAFAGIARRYGISYWDYSADPICGEKAYFYNSQHLNYKGAAAFSSKLADRLANEVLRVKQAGLQRAGARPN